MAVSIEEQRSSSPTIAEEKEVGEASFSHIDVANGGQLPAQGSAEDQAFGFSRQTVLAFVALCGQFNAYVMTLLVPSTILTYINQELGPNPNYTWITVSWQLGASVVVSVGGRLSDIFGRRYFMLTGSLLGVVGCVIGATGQSVNQMIASGVIFGVASGFQEMSYACIQEILPNNKRMLGIGIFDASLLPAYFSPLISYAFIAHYDIGWRAAYWYMFSMHTLLAVVLFFFYHPPDFEMKHRRDGKTKRQLLSELDYVGLLLFAGSSTLLLLGVNFGGRQYAWKSAEVVAPIVAGILCAITQCFWESRPGLRHPILPPKLVRNVRGFLMVIVVCFVGGMLYYSMNVLWPQQSAQFFIPADKPLMRGVYASIFPFGNFVGALIMAFFCARFGREKWQLTGFMILQTALIGSMASVGVSDKAQAIAVVAITGSAVTAPQLVSFTVLSLGLEDQTDIGIAVGLAGTFRLLGGAIATAIYTAILSNRFDEVIGVKISQVASRFGMPQSVEPALLAAAKQNTEAAYAQVPDITDAITAAARATVKLSYVEAFKLVYLVSIAFGGVAIMAAFCTKSTDTARKTNERAVVLKNEAGAREAHR